MDSLIKQVWGKFSNVGQENKQETSSSKERRIPLQKTRSFKGEKKKAQNWFQRQFSRSMSRDYDSNTRIEKAAAVAAAAYAIKSLEESHIRDRNKTSEGPLPLLTRLRSKKEDAPASTPEESKTSESHQPSFTRLGSKKDYAADTHGSIERSLTRVKSKKEDTPVSITESGNGSKRFSGEMPVNAASDERTPERASSPPPMKKTISFADQVTDATKTKRTPSTKKTPTFADNQLLGVPNETDSPPLKPDIPPSTISTTPPAQTRRPSSTKPATDETEADAWEKAELEKIKERYEKLNETINSWESKKKKKARSKLDRTERELERRRLKALTKFRNDMESIDQIAGGARAQAEERRRNEEFKAKEKANVFRRTGKAPATCLCF